MHLDQALMTVILPAAVFGLLCSIVVGALILRARHRRGSDADASSMRARIASAAPDKALPADPPTGRLGARDRREEPWSGAPSFIGRGGGDPAHR